MLKVVARSGLLRWALRRPRTLVWALTLWRGLWVWGVSASILAAPLGWLFGWHTAARWALIVCALLAILATAAEHRGPRSESWVHNAVMKARAVAGQESESENRDAARRSRR